MSRFQLHEKKFGKYDVVILTDKITGCSASIVLQGATLINFFVKLNEQLFDVVDGFASPEEFDAKRGARNWIMTPFANRVSKGEYVWEGELLKMEPIHPRKEVTHGFTSYENFTITEIKDNDDSIEVTFFTDALRPGIFPGYPFAINVYIKYKMEENKLTIEVTGENVGDCSAPFMSGWHSYFRTSDKGIEHLILTIDADKIIIVDDKYIPIPGNSAYRSLDEFKNLDFRSSVKASNRIISKKELNNCYVDLNKDQGGISISSIYDPVNKMKINLFQKGGALLAFTGDSLSARVRKSIALEPMQFITNAYNREELIKDLKIMPGEKSIFKFGFEVEM